MVAANASRCNAPQSAWDSRRPTSLAGQFTENQHEKTDEMRQGGWD